MSLSEARDHLARFNLADRIVETSGSSATVELAAAELGTEPERIAKTLAFYGAEPQTALLVVAAGDVRVDNAAFKRTFGLKAKMLRGEDVEALTGHAPGGVCPFGNPTSATVYLDESLSRFDTLFPAVGNAASAIEMTPAEIAEVVGAARWVSVTKVGE